MGLSPMAGLEFQLRRRNWLKDVDRDAIMCKVRDKLREKGMLKELSELEEGSNVYGVKGLIEKFGRLGVEEGEQAWNPKNPSPFHLNQC